MLGATASLIRLKRNGVSVKGHLMPPCSFLRLGAVAGVPPAALQGGSLLRHPTLAAILSLLLALVACSGSPSAGPTATGATGPASAEPPTAVRASQPQTQTQTDRTLALAPTGRTPIPALNTRQISAMQQAQVSEIKTRYAPTSERVTPPPPTLPVLPSPPTIPPMPVLPIPGPTPRLLPTIEPPPPLPAFPPPPAVAYPTFAPSKLVAPTLAPPTLVTSPARQDFLAPISSPRTEATA